MLQAREDDIRENLEKLKSKEREILEYAKKISTEIFPGYKDKLVRISRSMSSLKFDDLGNTDDIVKLLLKNKGEIEESVIEKVKILRKKFETALALSTAIRGEKYKNRDREPVTRLSSESLKRIQAMKLTEEGEIEEPSK